MDLNSSQSSEIKTRREKFSISIRRNTQDRFFDDYRKRVMTKSGKAEKYEMEKENIEPKVPNQSVIDEFVELRVHLVDCMTQRNIAEATDTVARVRMMVSASSEIDLVPVTEFFESGLPRVLIQMTKVPQVMTSEAMITELVWTLSSAFVAHSTYINQMIEDGIIAVFGEWLPTADPVMTEHIVWALANYLGDDPNNFETLLNYQIWNILLERLNLFIKNIRIARVASWLFGNALRYSEVPSEIVR